MLSLTHIHLRVQDPEDAAQWYVNMLEANSYPGPRARHLE